jgi:N-acetylmuramoyl-L-alanine amidase
MGGWARLLLLASMGAWTAFTAGLGLVALGGDAEPTSGAREFALHNTAAPGGLRDVRLVPVEQTGPAIVGEEPGAPATATPMTPRSTGQVYAVPDYAVPAGAERRVRPADTRRPPPDPRPSARGVVVLDPGHGRGDPGATHYLPDGRYDITEAYSNLRNAELIRDNLQAMGYEVYLTREGAGRGPGVPLPLQWITSDLFARVALARAVDADVYLASHGNGASVKSISGPETWYCGKHEEGAANETLATMVQQAMMDALHEYGYFPPDRGIKEDAESHHSGDFCQFVVTRETAVPAALLEFLFLSNDDDARVLVDDRSHVLMARHVADAIERFLAERGVAR